jgi:hypothetical protein
VAGSRTASCTLAPLVLLSACAGIEGPDPSSPRPMREIIGNRTPAPTVSLSLTPTPSPTPTPTPAPAEEPEERYALKDAFPRIDGFRYRDVPARILRSIVRRWRNRMGDARTVLDGPRRALPEQASPHRRDRGRFRSPNRRRSIRHLRASRLREGSGREGSAAAGPWDRGPGESCAAPVAGCGKSLSSGGTFW